MSRRFLLTGATGFVGANVVRHLLARGDEVVCVLRKPNLCVEGLPVTLSTASMTDADALAKAAEGSDGVFHVAGTFDPGPEGEALMRTIHVDATKALIAACKAAGVPRLVLCSSSITVGFGPKEAPGDEDSPLDPDRVYGRSGALRTYYDTKLESEHLAADAGHVIVNPDYVLGAWDIRPTSGQLLLSVAKGWVPVHPRGGKCFVDADDCAIGHLRAMDVGRPGRRYLLGNHNASYKEFMDLCAAAAGTRGPVLPMPNVVMHAAGLAGRVLSRVDTHRFAGLDANVLNSMRELRYRTGRRSWEELGVPRTDLRETIQKALGWFREFGYL